MPATILPATGAATRPSVAPAHPSPSELVKLLGEVKLDGLVMIAAGAIVAAERAHGSFCRSCGLRLQLKHAATCVLAEPGDRVERDDVADVEEMVRVMTATMRGAA